MNNIFLNLVAQKVRLRTLLAYRKKWRQLPIEENGEKLVPFPKELTYPFYALELKMIVDPALYARESVLTNFLKAKELANEHGFELIVYDAWRSVQLQENLFWHYLKQFTVPRFQQLEQFFQLANTPTEIKEVFYSLPQNFRETLKEENRTYVSWPSTDLKSPSPHATGGSIDVWLHKDGKPVNFGIPFDWMEETAGAFYHLKLRRKKFSADKTVCFHRNVLLHSMTKAGFTCYGPEIWHFNCGNQMDSLVTGNIACYSYIEP